MKAKREWSNYQQAIFKDIANGTGHTVIIAKAGSGKSSSLIEGLKYIPKKISGISTKTLMLAFNKSIQQTLADHTPSYIETSTFHSLGFKAVKNAFGKSVALDPNKTLNIIQNLLEEKEIKKQAKDSWPTTLSMLKMVSLCKSYLIDTPSKMDDLMDKFDIDPCKLERIDFIKMACQSLRLGKQEKRCIDFDEMIFFPSVFSLPVGKWDRVIIDELQDLSKAQIQMALTACKSNGRIIAVGDPKQSCYAFRGADSNAVDDVIKKLNAKVLPLSITYRCAKSITKKAQEIVPDIECPITAKDGLVSYLNDDEFLKMVKPGDFIISRINAPLIKYCLALLKLNIRANIKGRDVGSNLAWMIKNSEKTTVQDFLEWLAVWKKSETARLISKGRDPIIINDKADCLESLCKDEKNLSGVLSNIKELFNDGDDSTRITLSSTHRIKGAEAERVFMLYDTYRLGMNDEENNLIYIAYTRAKSALYIVSRKY